MLLAFASARSATCSAPRSPAPTAVWDISVVDRLNIVLGNVLGLLTGFMLGVLIRNSRRRDRRVLRLRLRAAPALRLLAATQEWFRDIAAVGRPQLRPGPLFSTEGALSGEQWANLGVTAVVWILLPLVVGLTLVRRSEVS